MNTFKLSLILLIASVSATMAQTTKKMLVEHFTNTKCSICASLNPGFYANLRNQPPGIRHIAYHPSSPYVGCLFSQQNKPENDARTNYYNVYGGTPKILINGTVIQVSSNYNSPTIFDPFENQTSPIEVRMSQEKTGDSVRVKVVVKRVADGGNSSLLLYGGLAEDTVNYTGSNGESRHYDVFRKAVFGINGTAFSAPASIGDSVEFTSTVWANPIWDINRIFAYSVVQETGNKKLVQSEALPAGNFVTTNVAPLKEINVQIAPNPASDYVVIQGTPKETIQIRITDVQGRIHLEKTVLSGEKLNIANLPAGVFIVSWKSGNQSGVLKMLR
jgi:hypothetical protein